MKSIFEQRDGTEQGLNSTTRINSLPDEILINIFDSYRQYCRPIEFFFDGYWRWRERHGWLEVGQVCRRWRAVMSSSAFRLNLAINVGPKMPDDIETILSGPWPILIDYCCKHDYPTDSSLKRMYSALEHHDRVRGIYLYGPYRWFDNFFKATNCPFPALETLYLCSKRDDEMEIPDTFLGGPDGSNLRLRSLTLLHVSLASTTGLLSSATSLTDLSLELNYSFSPSAGISLLASLQGMHCLRNLELVAFSLLGSPSQPVVPKEVVPLSKLTKFYYKGSSIFLYALVAGISAPSLQKIDIEFRGAIQSPTAVHLPRFIDEIRKQYQAVIIYINESLWSRMFSLTLESDFSKHGLTNSEQLCLESGSDSKLFPESMMHMSGALSAKLSTVEVLRVNFGTSTPADYVWEDYLPWRRFYRHLSSVKSLQITYSMARTLYQNHGELDDLFVLPALEEIHFFQPGIDESERGTILAAFQPFVNAREQAGRPVNVFFGRPKFYGSFKSNRQGVV